MIDRERLAWAAGFFDGEGCFTRNTGYPAVAISQTDRRVLDRFCESVAGLGRIVPVTTQGRPSFSYYAYGAAKVQAIGAMLWAFLSPVKRAQFMRIMRSAVWPSHHLTPEHRTKIGAAQLGRKQSVESIVKRTATRAANRAARLAQGG